MRLITPRTGWMLPALFTLLLSACDIDLSSVSTGNAATASVSPSGTLGIRDNLVITFSKPMDPGSLSFDGGLGVLSDGGTWSSNNKVLTLAPDDAWGAWESGNQPLKLTVEDTVGNVTTVDTTLGIDFTVSDFQNAAVVIGQTDFTGSSSNQGGVPGADTLNFPYSDASFFDDILWLPDFDNNRVLGFDGIPTVNGASASYVVGQGDFMTGSGGTTDSSIEGPQRLLAYNGHYYLLEYANNRILIFDSAPYAAPRAASAVLGQADFTSSSSDCSAQGLYAPEDMTIADGKLLVADGANNRILVWNSVPTATGTEPDLVLGQADFTHCTASDDNQDNVADAASSARTLSGVSGVWTDGSRLVAADTENSRVLIWNRFPTENFQPADIVLGQADFAHNIENDDNQDGVADATPTARTLNHPYDGVWSNGRQLFVPDTNNHRLLVWNRFPTESFQPADRVLGQSDFVHATADDDNQDNASDMASARTFYFPVGGALLRDKLLITDGHNNRALVFEAN
ncbi:hypothetical protein EZI54_19820 [Marinobacter halodurans]|uniref:SbsA Ig-like domain-containing protein n=1 Tax=Marinobacter halodurans TaxID=2528979 RepID=A0ABY1ZHZ6_9GAMM|nr:hypothetical protein EZI54_19820 [Marinobacter halodurans]